MSEFTPLREAVETLASRTSSPDFGELERRAVRRGRRRVVMVAAATVAVVAGSVLAIAGPGHDRQTLPMQPPKPVVAGAVPVWWDAKGLHRGNIVVRTPVDLGILDGPPDTTDTLEGALALVRTGAMYLDPATGDVWFHPWGGDPRIVGGSSEAGPGGEPNGDTAVWFEGGELVVYDTAAGREISRTLQSHAVGLCGTCGEHRPAGNWFLQVSAERVVWIAGWESNDTAYSYDVRSQQTSVISVVDVHDQVEVLDGGSTRPGADGELVLAAAGRSEDRYPELEPRARLSPSGSYLLAVESTDTRHGAVIVDTRTGELWRVPKNVYPWLAWSYGDIAMVDHTGDQLLACDAARHTCEPLQAERPFLLPTN